MENTDEGQAPAYPESDREVPERLQALAKTFHLSSFEQEVLLLCAAVELDSSFPTLVNGDPHQPGPTFGLALATLPEPHWDALSPCSPLRYWRLVDLEPGPSLIASRLRIDERILHFLTDVPCLDQRLEGLVQATPTGALTPSQESIAAELAELFPRLSGGVIVLDGADRPAKRRVAGRVAAALGRALLVLSAARLPTSATEAIGVARLVEREIALVPALVLVEASDTSDVPGLLALVEDIKFPLLTDSGHTIPAYLVSARRSIELPTSAEQCELWRHGLTRDGSRLDGVIEQLSQHYHFSVATIEAITAEIRADRSVADMATRLRQACRERGRLGLEGLAERIEPRSGWEDLVLPSVQRRLLEDVIRQVRHRECVYEEWGMARAGARGLAVTALFTGESGTGKTLAAEVLAAELELDLYRIDLSAVVSKYIGETEKNLARVFDAAESSGSVLLFDEADALFGKRSEVKDSHDRYANVEIAFLLQRMEAYGGLAILTTNMKSGLDRSFLRRIRFVVSFPFPEVAERAEIWRRMLPASVPTRGLNVDVLAQLQVPGGTIRNIAFTATFLAADEASPVSMGHLAQAAKREYAKMERSLTETEIAGWA